MKKKLYGERAEKTKVITPSGRSKAHTLDLETEEEGSHQTGNTSSLGGRRHPFVDGILSVELLANWKGLGMDRSDGSTNPDEHIDMYVTEMSLYKTYKSVLCRVFPTSLKGMTLSWSTGLPLVSLDCFETLVSLFSI